MADERAPPMPEEFKPYMELIRSMFSMLDRESDADLRQDVLTAIASVVVAWSLVRSDDQADLVCLLLEVCACGLSEDTDLGKSVRHLRDAIVSPVGHA